MSYAVTLAIGIVIGILFCIFTSGNKSHTDGQRCSWDSDDEEE